MLAKFAALLALASLARDAVQAATVPTGEWPTSTGSVVSDKPIVVAAGTVYDGKMQTFDRSDITCQGQKEGGAKQAMFLVEAGATLKNVIIGKNQMEGVHCDSHDCTIENVWWSDVCEDALTIKGGSASSVSKVIGGGARNADDKVIQHNGLGKVTIDGFFADTFGKLYRSCGTCGNKQRTVEVSNVLARNPKVSLVTVNSNFGDKATLKNIFIESTKPKVVVCARSVGTTNGAEPGKSGDGADGVTCNYAANDIHLNASR
jgi:pectate lyase